MAALGAFLAVDLLWHAASPDHSEMGHSGAFAVGQDMPTSFGVLTVKAIEQTRGPTAQAMGGMASQGMQGHVGSDQVQIQVSVQLTNRHGQPVPYAPTQFQLLAEPSHTPIPLTGANFPLGTLQPKSSILASLRYIAPRDGSPLRLEYRDPDRGEPIRFDLGRLDDSSQDQEAQGGQEAQDGHHYDHASS